MVMIKYLTYYLTYITAEIYAMLLYPFGPYLRKKELNRQKKAAAQQTGYTIDNPAGSDGAGLVDAYIRATDSPLGSHSSSSYAAPQHANTPDAYGKISEVVGILLDALRIRSLNPASRGDIMNRLAEDYQRSFALQYKSAYYTPEDLQLIDKLYSKYTGGFDEADTRISP